MAQAVRLWYNSRVRQKQNITLALDPRLVSELKTLPEVQATSVSTYVAELIVERLRKNPDAASTRLMANLERASQQAQTGWTWNRDEVYER